ncbi:MAG: hypothetical protein WBG86_05440 [Polyangiales bacterium]
MTSRSLIIGAVAALLTLGACSKGQTADSAASAASSDPVLLIEAGAEPRSELRYKITDGTITKSNMDFRLATLAQTSAATALAVVPGVRLHIVSGPSMRTDDGIQFEVNIDKAEAMIPEGVDPAVAEDLRQSAAILDKVGGAVVIDNRGFVRSTKLNQRASNPDLPPRLLLRLINARTTLARVVLPAEPVGVGAQWEAEKEIVIYGFQIKQVDTYTLVDRVGDEIKLSVSVVQTAQPQTVDFPEDGVSLAVENMSAKARGEIVLNLNALESDAAAAGESNSVLMASSEGATQKVEVSEAFEVRMTNTTALE